VSIQENDEDDEDDEEGEGERGLQESNISKMAIDFFLHTNGGDKGGGILCNQSSSLLHNQQLYDQLDKNSPNKQS
jgi:hypothetical protein